MAPWESSPWRPYSCGPALWVCFPDWSRVPVRGQGEATGRTSGPLGRNELPPWRWARDLPRTAEVPSSFRFSTVLFRLSYRGQPRPVMEDKLLPFPLPFTPSSGKASSEPVVASGKSFFSDLGPRTSSSPFVEQGAHSLRHVPPRESFVEFSNEMQGNRRDWSFPPGTRFT